MQPIDSADGAMPAPRHGPLWRVGSYVDKVLAIAAMETHRLRHGPTELLTRAIQPMLWRLWSAAGLGGVIALVVLGAALFATFSPIIACIVKSPERFMGIGQVLTMPLFFASNAIYPIEIMPGWLEWIAHVNPLTYEVDGLRASMLAGAQSAFGLGFDFTVLGLTLAALVAVGGWIYPRIVT